MEYFLQLVLAGLTKGSIYALIALGYTMVYGVFKLINFAHGEIYMIGAFTALIVGGALQITTDLAPSMIFLISLVAAIFFSAAHGATMERIAYRPLRQAPRLTALISAIGMSLILQNYVRLAQTSDFLPFHSMIPDIPWLTPGVSPITTTQLTIVVTTVVVMISLTLFIKFTKMGKAMRAAAQDRIMAQLVGIDMNRVATYTFVIGSVTAAIGGVLIANHMGQINFYIGFLAGIKAFVAAVLGGIGSIPGAVLGSFVLGMAESFGAGYISSAYEDAFAFIILIIVLIFKPSGLLGRNEVEKV
ncbi:High-affinity branched-chain amino acid transport system permease protein LivH (TC 3.A.1.4.1) [Olavius algarvensis spirochete endosymbiont]|uniref:branched-chain amino acid ABC transporter permease n=1 Tax=Olavius algarvensis spirochete endosymbiont TaxID=260710 RepID=UPI000F1FA136|nr:branched-chain amino acid ABC transporter permease LivH [Olavius algarvensis spirochete endosymbiont]CAD7844921.1 MAG: Branched-chain amino acid ABC transporter, permease protein LivH (TC 3.A.1.4.1) [Olavius algarvensis spirochete endosymbiont]VDB00961.1 High-affinity branched-chain amino acid transport system permease protein LivH (TC 3.A.1.4.1) [Olavius algarvensis spirochete endosymbiont]